MVIKRIAFMAALLSLLYSGAFAAEKEGTILPAIEQLIELQQ